jgi:anti-sigma factor RsiW
MPDCSLIDRLATPYVDGELPATERQAVDAHLSVCPLCRARMAVEQTVRSLMRSKRSAITVERAPQALRARCAASAGQSIVGQAFRPAEQAGLKPLPTAVFQRALRTYVGPVALAASLVLVVGGAFLYQLTARSNRVMAAELTADHVKCFLLHRDSTPPDSKASVEQSLANKFQWNAQLPEQANQAGLELLGERTCLYGQGRVAHIMYEHDGRPVSIFMLPNTAREADVVEMFGHGAAVWSVGGRTFVLVAQEARADLERMASMVRAGIR